MKESRYFKSHKTYVPPKPRPKTPKPKKRYVYPRKPRTPEQIEKDRVRSREYMRKLKETNSPQYPGNKFHNDKKYRQRQRRNWLKRFGITPEEYDAMFAAQEGKCAICLQPERVLGKFGKPKALAVDHNHQTGKNRQLCCHACNTGLGNFKEDTTLLLRAVDYLDRHSLVGQSGA